MSKQSSAKPTGHLITSLAAPYPGSTEAPSAELLSRLARLSNQAALSTLHEAANSNDTYTITRIAPQANVNALDRGTTALHVAVIRNHAAATTALLKHGASTRTPDIDGSTALHLAIDNGFNDLAKTLIDHSVASIDLANKYGTVPLHMATYRSNLAMTTLLLDKGANVHLADRHGTTALHIAAERGELAIAKKLLQKGARPDMYPATDSKGAIYQVENSNTIFDTPLDTAARAKNQDIATLFLAKMLPLQQLHKLTSTLTKHRGQEVGEFLLPLVAETIEKGFCGSHTHLVLKKQLSKIVQSFTEAGWKVPAEMMARNPVAIAR